eukprot:768016-Hanusia_phi.AAC.6
MAASQAARSKSQSRSSSSCFLPPSHLIFHLSAPRLGQSLDEGLMLPALLQVRLLTSLSLDPPTAPLPLLPPASSPPHYPSRSTESRRWSTQNLNAPPPPLLPCHIPLLASFPLSLFLPFLLICTRSLHSELLHFPANS